MSENKTVMKVAAKSNVKSTAGSIVKHWSDGKEIELSVVGAGALNQAFKATATAAGILATKGKELLIKPGFSDVTIDGESRTALSIGLVIR